MNYVPAPGIVRTTLCGMNVLIPTRQAFESCHTIFRLTLIGAIIWTGIEKNYPMEKVLEAYRIFSKKSDEELTAKVEEFCQALCRRGFALPAQPAPEAEQ